MYRLAVANAVCFVVTVFLYSVVLCQDNSSDCGTCNLNSCEPPRNCLAGLVKDSCDCCHLCGRKEGERCEHKDLPSQGLSHCGENLECQVRNDLDWDDPPEAICVCDFRNPICGSDGVTYDNFCQLTEARYSRRDGLRIIALEPCPKPPKIVSPPQNIRNATGSYAVLTCEASGWPLPNVHWELYQDNSLIKLPGNNSRLVAQFQNGPNKDETTSWLLFLSLSTSDEGTYQCKAENDIGSVTETATVSVI